MKDIPKDCYEGKTPKDHLGWRPLLKPSHERPLKKPFRNGKPFKGSTMDTFLRSPMGGNLFRLLYELEAL